jgi:hypothetical protein
LREVCAFALQKTDFAQRPQATQRRPAATTLPA